jgi:hypothetical protein
MAQTILELFKSKNIGTGIPLAPISAEEKYAVRNSKDIPTEPKNPLLKPAFKLRDAIQKRTSRRDRETLLEEELGGIKALMLLSGPVIYGTELIRLKTKTTDSRDLMVSKANGSGGSRGLLGGVAKFIKNGPKKLASLIGAKFPEQMIPSRFIDNPNFNPGESSLIDDIQKIKKQSEGNGFGRFLSKTVNGTPQQIGNNVISGAIGEGKKAVENLLFGSRKNGGQNLAKKPANQRYYDVNSLYSNVVDETNTSISQRYDLSTKFDAFRTISKSGGIFGPKWFGKKYKDTDKNQNNKLISYAYQIPYLGQYNWNDRLRIGWMVDIQKHFIGSGKPGIDSLGKSLQKNEIEIYPVDSDGLRIPYTDTIDVDNAFIQERNDLSTHLDSVVEYKKTNPQPKVYNFDLGIEESGIPSQFGVYQNYSNTDADPLSGSYGSTWGYDTKRRITDYREIKNGQGDLLNKQGVLNNASANVKVGSTAKTLDEIDFITFKIQSLANNRFSYFRGTITGYTETFSPNYAQHQSVGMAYPLYTFETIERTISFTFKVYSQNIDEHKKAWERLQYLGHQTMPQGFTRTRATKPPLIKFWLGDMFKGRVSFIETLGYTSDEKTPWEIGLNAGGDCYKLPMIIDVSITIHLIEEKEDLVGTGGGNISSYEYIYDFSKNKINRTNLPGNQSIPTTANPNVTPANTYKPKSRPQMQTIQAPVTTIPTPRQMPSGTMAVPKNLPTQIDPNKFKPSGNPANLTPKQKRIAKKAGLI